MQVLLLGAFQVIGSGEIAIRFRSDSERALLAYLAVESGRPHRREALGAFLWPETSPDQARNNLRVALHRLKQGLESGGASADLLVSSRTEIRLDSDADLFVDFRKLADAVEAAQQHAHGEIHTCPDCIAGLAAAAELYRGEFLEGFSLDDNEPFEDWVRNRREVAHRAILETLFFLGERAFAGRNPIAAEGYARRQLELEPWREKAHRQLITALVHRGERPAALAQYGVYVDVLREELAMEPSSEMEDLYERIRTGEFEVPDPPPVSQPEDPPSDPGGAEVPRFEPGEIGPPRGRSLDMLGWIALGGVLLIAALAGVTFFPGESYYDRFDDPAFEGGVDPARWSFPHDLQPDSCAVRQTAGELVLEADAGGPDRLCILRVRDPETAAGSELGSLVAAFRADEPARSGAYGASLRFSASFEDGDWNADCGLSVEAEGLYFLFSISDTRLPEPDGELESASIPAAAAVWHEIRLEVDPETMETVCSGGGEEIGRYPPEEPGLLRSAPFVRELLPWESPDAAGRLLIDDFRIDPAPASSGAP